MQAIVLVADYCGRCPVTRPTAAWFLPTLIGLHGPHVNLDQWSAMTLIEPPSTVLQYRL